jgi:hypothetical protein
MADDIGCTHVDTIPGAPPVADGCVECLRSGARWVHLRRCTTCGHVGCCNSSPNKHAEKHAAALEHPVVQSFEPGEDWYWCYVDEVGFDVPQIAVSYSHP